MESSTFEVEVARKRIVTGEQANVIKSQHRQWLEKAKDVYLRKDESQVQRTFKS